METGSEVGNAIASRTEEYPLVIEETRPHPGPSVPSLATLRDQYLTAVSALDLRASRKVVLEAAAAGIPLSRLYTHVVRPGLIATGTALGDAGSTAYERLVLGNVRATLTLLGAQPPAGDRPAGHGRHAIVSVGARPLEALDGQVIADVLAGDGWEVAEVPVETTAEAVAELATERSSELAVMPTTRAADLLAAAAAYTQLRRLADPPLIVACSIGERDELRRARNAGADAFVGDLDELREFVAAWLPGTGARHWGVRLRQRADTLVITPTGLLDSGSVARLREVVQSRAGRFGAFVIDSRSVASVTSEGLDDLAVWLREPFAGSRAPRLVAGHHVSGLLDDAGHRQLGPLLLDAAEIA